LSGGDEGVAMADQPEVTEWLAATGWRFAGLRPLSPPSGVLLAEVA